MYICWSYFCFESNIFPPWFTSRVHEWQWTTVHIMKEFAEIYCFTLTTSSQHYLQSNERTVKTVKKLISDTDDPFLALLSYRATPLPWCGLSSMELVIGRCSCTDVPKYVTPNWPHLKDYRGQAVQTATEKVLWSETSHTHTHCSLASAPVWVSMQGNQSPGTVTQQLEILYCGDSYWKHLRLRSENTTRASFVT